MQQSLPVVLIQAGDRSNLGYAITDMNGNYIFRFTQSFGELVNKIDADVGQWKNVVVAGKTWYYCCSYPDSLYPSTVLFETAPYFNVPQLKRIDLCLPQGKVKPTSLCFNGNLIGSLGNVFIGGNQNTTGGLSAARWTVMATIIIWSAAEDARS